MSTEKIHELGWVLIPPAILAAENLCMGEKVVCGRVIGLVGKHGYCFASNEWLGRQLGYSERTVEDYIGNLVSKGYLHRAYGPNGKRDRQLYPIPEMTGKAIPIPEMTGFLPGNDRVPSRSGPGSSIGSSVESSETEEVPSSGSRPRRPPEQRMKREDLNRLTEYYAAIRGSRPQGNAWKPIQQAFRQMVVVEGYSVEQVIGCMERIAELGWTWSINTVRRWIADYAAGTMPTEGLEVQHKPSQLRPGTSRGHAYYLGKPGQRRPALEPWPERDDAAGAIWDDAMERLASELAPPTLETWFQEVVPTAVEDGHLHIWVPDPFTKGAIERRYAARLDELLSEVRGQPTQLVVEWRGAR